MNIFCMNSIPERVDNLRVSVPVLLEQADRFYVNLINYDHTPEILKSERVIVNHFKDKGAEYKFLYYNDIGKDDYYFTVDDDIIYPRDYADVMINNVKRYEGKAVSCVHGRKGKSSLRGLDLCFHFTQGLDDNTRVMQAGTGTSCFYGGLDLKISMTDFQYKNMDDTQIACKLYKQGIPAYAVKRKKNWLRRLPSGGKTIWETRNTALIEQMIQGSMPMNTYCINLDERKDRWERTVEECGELDITPIRFPAIEAKCRCGSDKCENKECRSGGCALSHLAVLELVLSKGEDEFMVIEDDIMVNVYKPVEILESAYSQLPPDWDMFYLGARPRAPLVRYSENLFRLKDAWCRHAIIFNNRNGVVDYILSLKEITEPRLIRDTFYRQYIQSKFNCYVVYPMILTQQAGHSDILSKIVTYKEILADYVKNTVDPGGK